MQRDAYNQTGCYNDECAGFVRTSSTISLGAAIDPVSTSGGSQVDITIQIWKDHVSGHWWLGMGHNVKPVGYWPGEIFTGLSDYAHHVDWGGEASYMNTSGKNAMVQMGSGEYPEKGYRKAAYFCDIRVAENNETLLPLHEFEVAEDYPNYTVKKSYSRVCGNHFYYGGPGPGHSEAAGHSEVVTFSLHFGLFFGLVFCF